MARPTPGTQPRKNSVAQKLSHPESQIEGLAGVEPGVAGGGVADVEVTFEDLLGAAQAFGHVVACELHVHTARPGAGGAMDGKERAQLAQDVIEAPRLAPALTGEGVAVHGVARPD